MHLIILRGRTPAEPSNALLNHIKYTGTYCASSIYHYQLSNKLRDMALLTSFKAEFLTSLPIDVGLPVDEIRH